MTDHSTCWASGYSAGHDRAVKDITAEAVAMEICREKCAFLGEPACFNHFDGNGNPLPWPAPECDEPGCMALAEAVIAKIRSAAAKKVRP